ncbi:MAG: hypothetical protein WD627_04440 [Actinomycetota bacterium]
MAEFQKRKAQENLSAVLANMGLRLSKEGPSQTDGEAIGPRATGGQGVADVGHSPEPPARPAAAAPRDPGEH